VGLAAVAAWSAYLAPDGGRRFAAATTAPAASSTSALDWQYEAAGADRVPEEALRSAAAITIAIVDTGADVSAPDIAAKHPRTHDTRSRTSSVSDTNGHGTFVASLAAGAVDDGGGVSGFGGDAQLLIVKADGSRGSFTVADEAKAIRYAVDRGARIINLSLSGTTTSPLERKAIRYAIDHGALLVAAAGNEYATGNPVEYPAALLQPVGSNGQGGAGLSVAASTRNGTRAAFSNTGSWVSLAAPGEGVLGAVSEQSSATAYPRVTLPGVRGLYGYASGTSFAAPEVAGAAALVWGVNPSLTAQEVARILKETASGHGTWTPELGYGVIDVAAAVARAGA
jgi:subtilisin family serine protease